MITSEQIKVLRDQTGVSVMQCKKALEDAGGDYDKALLLLKKKGAEVATKKSERKLGAGIVQSYIHSNGSIGAMVELNSESDFVARNPEFKTLAYDIAMHITATCPEYLKESEISPEERKKIEDMFRKEVDESGKPEEIKKKMLEGKVSAFFDPRILLKQLFVKNPDETINDLLNKYIQKFGERIEIGKFTRICVSK